MFTTEKRPLKVFLCHAHADRDPVRELYTRLTKDGVDAWLDKVKLLPGQDWELEIRKAVREADVVVVCLSKQFNQAGFRQKEVRLALDTAMEKPEGEIFIIPARLEESENLESLRRWQWVDLFEEDGYERLLRTFHVRANKIGVTLQIKKSWFPNIIAPPKIELHEEKKSESKLESSKSELKRTKLKKSITFLRSNVAINKIVLLFLAIVGVISVFFFPHYWTSVLYDFYYTLATNARPQVVSLFDPVMQRDAWKSVLLYVDKAEAYQQTGETQSLRQEANTRLDQLFGIVRLQFQPVFSNGLGIEISRIAASETDLFILNASSGEVLHAQFLNESGFQLDSTFNCAPGIYGDYTIGPLVDILAMPGLNSINSMLGIDAEGNLLYCAQGQAAQAIPLPSPDAYTWGRVTAFTLDDGNLYVLDTLSRMVWVYTGNNGVFIDKPYSFFDGQTLGNQDVIDLLVSGDDIYLLHTGGHLSSCSHNHTENVSTNCQNPTALINPFKAYYDIDLFGTAKITQMSFGVPPDTSILLLGTDYQSVFRLTLGSPGVQNQMRSLELQNQIRPTDNIFNVVPSQPVKAMAVGANHVLYIAVEDQVYFATGMP